MDPKEASLADVLSMWQANHPVPAVVSGEEAGFQCTAAPATHCRRSRRRRPANWEAKPSRYIAPLKFRLQKPVLKFNHQIYSTPVCNQCKDHIRTLQCSRSVKNRTVNLLTYNAKRRSLLQSQLSSLVERYYSPVCVQTTDIALCNYLAKKCQPRLYIHSGKSVLHSLLVYLYILSSHKNIPYIAVHESAVPSSSLRSMLSKIGFIFLSDTTHNSIQFNSHVLVELLNKGSSVIIWQNEGQGQLLRSLLDLLRSDEGFNDQSLLIPVTCSFNNEVTKDELFLSDVFFPSLTTDHKHGLSHVNISTPVFIKSLFETAKENNTQEVAEEENNLIVRHLNCMHYTATPILPRHLVSFVLLTLRQQTVTMATLSQHVAELVEELLTSGRYLGFTGLTEDITKYGLNTLVKENVVMVTEYSVATLQSKCLQNAIKLFDKTIFQTLMPKAVVSVGIIVASSGGMEQLLQQRGEDITCQHDAIAEGAEFMSDVISYLLDYHCSVSTFSSDIIDAIGKMVSADLLQTCQTTYDDERHRKLAQHLTVEVEDQEEDEVVARKQTYKLLTSDENICTLNFFRSCVQPFIEIVFLVALSIKHKEERFTVQDLLSELKARFEKGLVIHGETIDKDMISRCCEYLFEKLYIDDDLDGFRRSQEPIDHFLTTIEPYRR